MARTIHPPSPPKPISSLRVEFLPCEGLSGTSLPSTIVCLGVRRQSGEAMKCVRTGSAQNTAQPFGEKQRVEKMTYNCEAGSCDRLVRSQGADQVFEPWAMVLLQSATFLTTTSFRYTQLGMAALSHLNSHVVF